MSCTTFVIQNRLSVIGRKVSASIFCWTSSLNWRTPLSLAQDKCIDMVLSGMLQCFVNQVTVLVGAGPQPYRFRILALHHGFSLELSRPPPTSLSNCDRTGFVQRPRAMTARPRSSADFASRPSWLTDQTGGPSRPEEDPKSSSLRSSPCCCSWFLLRSFQG